MARGPKTSSLSHESRAPLQTKGALLDSSHPIPGFATKNKQKTNNNKKGLSPNDMDCFSLPHSPTHIKRYFLPSNLQGGCTFHHPVSQRAGPRGAVPGNEKAPVLPTSGPRGRARSVGLGGSAALPRPAWSSAGVTGRPRCRKDAPEGGGCRSSRVTPKPSPPPLPGPRHQRPQRSAGTLPGGVGEATPQPGASSGATRVARAQSGEAGAAQTGKGAGGERSC